MAIQKLRLQRGWSQEQLAGLSGLSTRTIQRIERGQGASVDSLKALGAAFGVDFSELKESAMTATANANADDVPNQAAFARAEEALAFAHIRRVKGFYIHLAQFAAVLCVLAVINFWTSPRYLWVGWVALGWGTGVLFHGLRVFDKIPFLNGEWERRQVEKRLGRGL